MDSSNLPTLSEEETSGSEDQHQQQPEPGSAFASVPIRPPTPWVPLTLSRSLQFTVFVFFFSLNFNGFWCRSSLQKYSPLNWSAYFDREDDIRIKDTENVSLSVSNWSTFYSNRKSLFFCVCFCNCRYFMYIWREQKGLWFFVYMEVAILGMLLLSI